MTKRRGLVKKKNFFVKNKKKKKKKKNNNNNNNTELPQMVTEFMDMARSFGNAE